ncbi:DNA-processing protein DprA, partial [Clostridium sp.]|uniref:DNA-processing protein DprA n=1 Tax=Clostridium sp. TaxID=1506 RepID=UPI0026184FA4
ELLINSVEAERITKLLAKAGQLTFELDKLKNFGISVLTRADEKFPKVLKERLKDKCPPVIYYCGDINILNNSLVGVVGSRNIDEYGLEFTKKVAKKIVEDNYSLVSGGAKGVDGISQDEVLKNGGKVAIFIADSMINKIKKKEIREAITSKNLLIMSAINPNSGFTVYSAMDRNKYIYALSELTVIVSSDYNKGGTWAGATENIKNNWVPTLVRYDDNIPKGNKELIKLGIKKFDVNSFDKDFKDLVDKQEPKEEICYEGDLFSFANNNTVENSTVNKEIVSKEKGCTDKEEIEVAVENNLNEENTVKDYDSYKLLINNIREILLNPLSAEEFSAILNVNKTQGNTWLKRAVEDGVVKKTSKPVRYKSIN